MTTSFPDDSAQRAIVILDQPESPQAVAKVLSDVLGLSATDALIHARLAPGVLSDRLAAEAAQRLADGLQAAGIRAAVVAPAELLDFRTPHVVHHAHLLEQGLEIVTDRGTADGLIPWNRIACISAGQVPLETAQRYDWNDEHVFSTARRSHHDPHVAKLPPVMELWLVDRDDPRPFRLDQTRMNYETLGAIKTDSSTENFRLFLTRLVELAPAATLSPATRTYLDRGSLLQYSFPSTNDLQRATQLLLLRNRHPAN